MGKALNLKPKPRPVGASERGVGWSWWVTVFPVGSHDSSVSGGFSRRTRALLKKEDQFGFRV